MSKLLIAILYGIGGALVAVVLLAVAHVAIGTPNVGLVPRYIAYATGAAFFLFKLAYAPKKKT